ncbi:MAG: hypothetical protein AVDCRST_MAG77-5890, partial [uncultured Chloroflexi bacterium]
AGERATRAAAQRLAGTYGASSAGGGALVGDLLASHRWVWPWQRHHRRYVHGLGLRHPELVHYAPAECAWCRLRPSAVARRSLAGCAAL